MSGFVSPRSGWLGRLQDRLANARRLRGILRHLPFVRLDSDVRDVVYLNWVVPISAVAPMIPRTVCVVERDGMTILTVLTYAHGHFGPALAGPFRWLFPSPLQSNWRLYIDTIDGRVAIEPTVLFLHNLFDSAAYAIGSRMFSDALPSHLPAMFHHVFTEGVCETRIGGGQGSAADVMARVEDSTNRVLPARFAAFHDDWPRAIAALCLQDAAVAAFDDDALACARIDLPIDPAAVVPMTATTYRPGTWLRAIGATDLPFCFRVPRVRFRALSESIITG